MRKIFYSFLISCFIFTIISCGKSSSGTGGAGGGSETVTSECDGNNKGSFQIYPEKGAGLWEIVKNKKDCGYALVGGKNRKPWIQVIDDNGNQLISKTYDADFKDVTSNFGNGLPTEGQLDGSAISQTNDSGYIVGTYVNPRHSSYGYTHIFKTDAR